MTQASAGEVEQTIYEALRTVKEIGDVELTPETRFKDLGFTSLEMLTLVFEIEDRWGIAIKDAYLDDFRTVREGIDTVLGLLRKQAS